MRRLSEIRWNIKALSALPDSLSVIRSLARKRIAFIRENLMREILNRPRDRFLYYASMLTGRGRNTGGRCMMRVTCLFEDALLEPSSHSNARIIDSSAVH